ncbi:MAG: hypothetical protein JXA25_19605, partial [Anaerolineales bacterium]|nr:hypothetical protein [Anaerolineales bacterium]
PWAANTAGECRGADRGGFHRTRRKVSTIRIRSGAVIGGFSGTRPYDSAHMAGACSVLALIGAGSTGPYAKYQGSGFAAEQLLEDSLEPARTIPLVRGACKGLAVEPLITQSTHECVADYTD